MNSKSTISLLMVIMGFASTWVVTSPWGNNIQTDTQTFAQTQRDEPIVPTPNQEDESIVPTSVMPTIMPTMVNNG